MWTPFEISIVLHHHTSPAAFPRYEAPAYWPTVSRLQELGILDHGKDTPPTVTKRGAALIDMWLSQPLPIEKFVDPRFVKDSTLSWMEGAV